MLFIINYCYCYISLFVMLFLQYLESSVFVFQMSIVANDNSNPSRTGFVEAFITVIRDQFPPFFINTPYSVTISEYTNIESSIYNVNATDNDLVVCTTIVICFKQHWERLHRKSLFSFKFPENKLNIKVQ